MPPERRQQAGQCLLPVWAVGGCAGPSAPHPQLPWVCHGPALQLLSHSHKWALPALRQNKPCPPCGEPRAGAKRMGWGGAGMPVCSVPDSCSSLSPAQQNLLRNPRRREPMARRSVPGRHAPPRGQLQNMLSTEARALLNTKETLTHTHWLNSLPSALPVPGSGEAGESREAGQLGVGIRSRVFAFLKLD